MMEGVHWHLYYQILVLTQGFQVTTIPVATLPQDVVLIATTLGGSAFLFAMLPAHGITPFLERIATLKVLCIG